MLLLLRAAPRQTTQVALTGSTTTGVISTAPAATTTLPVTVPTDTTLLVVVVTAQSVNAVDTINALTAGGVAMTRRLTNSSSTSSVGRQVAVWVTLAPPAGSVDVVATTRSSGSSYTFAVTALTFSGAADLGPMSSRRGTPAASLTVSANTETTDAVITAVSARTTSTPAGGAGNSVLATSNGAFAANVAQGGGQVASTYSWPTADESSAMIATVVGRTTLPATASPSGSATLTATAAVAAVPAVTFGAYAVNEPYPLQPHYDLESLVGKPLRTMSWFTDWSGGFLTAEANAAKAGGYAIQYAWEAMGVSFADIVAGNRDTYITTWMTAAKNSGADVIVRLFHEMNGNWYDWAVAKSGSQVSSTAQWKQAWQRIAGIRDTVGAGNVRLMFCANSNDGGGTAMESYYPGDAYVDLLGVDGYAFGPGLTFPSVYKDMYDRLRAVAPGKDIWIGEIGTDSSAMTAAQDTAWWQTFYDSIRSYPRIRAVNFFHKDQFALNTVPATFAMHQQRIGETVVPIASLQDDFAGTLAKWPTLYGTNTSIVGGRLRLITDGGYSGARSAESYVLQGSSASARLYPPAAGGGTAANLGMWVEQGTAGTQIGAEIDAAAGTISFLNRVNYGDPNGVSIPYSPTAHAWVRVRESGGTLYWETSPDAVTWTNRRTTNTAAPGWVSQATSSLQFTSHREGGTADYAEVDNVNAAAAPPNIAGSASPNGSGQLQATAVPAVPAAAAAAGQGTLTAAGQTNVARPAVHTSDGQLSVVGVVSVAAAVSLTGGGQAAATPVPQTPGVASLSGQGTAAAARTVTPTPAAAGTGSGQLAATGRPGVTAAPFAAAAGTLSVQWAVAGAVTASVAPTGSGQLTVGSAVAARGAAAPTASATLTVTAVVNLVAAVAFSGSAEGGPGTYSDVYGDTYGLVAGTVDVPAEVNLTGSGAAAAAARPQFRSAPQMLGAATATVVFSSEAHVVAPAAAGAVGTAAAAATVGVALIVGAHGHGTLHAVAVVNLARDVAFTGDAAAGPSSTPNTPAAAAMTGTAALTGAARPGLAGEAAHTADGQLAAQGIVGVAVTVALSGDTSVTLLVGLGDLRVEPGGPDRYPDTPLRPRRYPEPAPVLTGPLRY